VTEIPVNNSPPQLIRGKLGWRYHAPSETYITMLMSSGLAIRLSARTFLVIDLVGLHVSFRGHEMAWTREYAP
jgi:hypothetical protein